MEEIKTLIDQYVAWLGSKITLRQVADWIEITTPYLDRNNDYLQIYARRQNGSYILTDDGYILDELEISGCKLESPKRSALLEMILNGFGVKLVNGAMEVSASKDDFPLRKHNLVQAMLAVNDLFYLASPMVTSLFLEDVIAWLDENEIRYTPNVKFTGKSGYDHLFDFVIPKSKKRPERILQAINRPSRDEAGATAFAWIDTREVRAADSRAYALLNDSEKPVSPSVMDALNSYEVYPILWSKRQEMVEELVV
ncbi:MAG: DUF1829 domain-containing protein [Methanothrix sp.]|jgi:hypothetical protein|uniref:DUF1829 domain-containing protein n=1 Tax=Methanothrix sp. TaxID=90426 RepID=UPI002BC6D3BC|nr:DUF1829 domain-containing protein [Methanothrix sp.]